MSKQVWICEKCQSLWSDEENAKRCEARHLPVTGVVALDYPKWSHATDQRFPERVRVTAELPAGSTAGEWDYATYRLERIGPRGL